MNIDSVNLSTVQQSSGTVASSGAVESVSQPVADGSAVSEGFSGALVAQIGLLSNAKTVGSAPLQVPGQVVNGSQVAAGLSVGKSGTQDFAALLGNDLPPTYKTKDDVDHQAALDAVTDTLKYIATGTTVGEKTAVAEQNMKDVAAMVVPVEKNMKDVAAMVVPVEQNVKGVAAIAVPVEQNMKGVAAIAVPVEQNMKEVAAIAVPVEQNMTDVVAVAVPVVQNATELATQAGQGMKDVVGMGGAVQKDLKQTNDKPDKKQVDGEAQIAAGAGNQGVDGLLAAIVLPAVMPTEQAKVANNLTSSDATKKEDGLLSFINPSAGSAKPVLAGKVVDDVLQSEAVFRQPVQDKQGFDLKYFENAGKIENIGGEQQAPSFDGEKALTRVGSDITQLNRPIVDNKTADVPAITKPLSHPEWNKDLGERIVWMNSRAIPAAEIRLNPPHLGPISVRVDVADDQATVVFTAQHAAVRETLEASIPKLREMMGAQQLNLVDVTVSPGASSDQGRSQSQNFAQSSADGRGQSGQGAAGIAIDGVDDIEQEIESGRAVVSNGLLSLYA
ncbi:MAG: flagellar hook-length control protein FliK [Methylobacter sp.]|jgi:flagellar hook-length control protein FliK|nr:flagellar hook-length control protein FliK [Methylobacter sp.]